MAIELRWLASTAASGLHAAAAMLQGATLVDPKLSLALAEPVRGMRGELDMLAAEPRLVFEHLIPLSAQFDSPMQLAEVTVTKLVGAQPPPTAVANLARRLVALDAAFQGAFPRALQELELRAEPLCGQWEARGPGLIAGVARLTEADLIVDRADVILVLPALGGAGTAHWLYNSACIEAVLANPIVELPEVVRLGWLLAQLNLDLPTFQGDMPRERLARVGRLAMLPPVLAAAEEVELARNNVQTLTLALSAWRAPEVEPNQLMEWWETYRAARPSWTVALGALDRMVGS
ncbi:MAG TPA: hypothetical protein VGZ26_07400 [Pirellulales bacterium]|jgi:hypothetical protein|nr:hypothetical protein [Pirellulales bacterium]